VPGADLRREIVASNEDNDLRQHAILPISLRAENSPTKGFFSDNISKTAYVTLQ
jgi:hypothetical protein